MRHGREHSCEQRSRRHADGAVPRNAGDMTEPKRATEGETPPKTPPEGGTAGDAAYPIPPLKSAADQAQDDQSGSTRDVASPQPAEATMPGPVLEAEAIADEGGLADAAGGEDDARPVGPAAPESATSGAETFEPASRDSTDAERADDVPNNDTERRPPRGIWSRQTIQAREGTERLFCDEDGNSLFDEKRLDPAGYRLAIGGEIYISPAKAKDKASVTFLEPRKGFFIPPGQFAFLLSDEVVKVPDYAFALIALRTRTKFKGLVNVSGFHADPGYHGRLIFAVFNAGPGDVHLRQGDDLFTISFASLDVETVKPRSEEERFLRIPSEIITPIAGEVQSLAGLKESIDEVGDEMGDRLHAIERELAILRWALALAASVVVGLLVRVFNAG